MSTEQALDLDQAVERFLAPEESAQDDSLEEAVNEITEEVDSEVESEEYSEEEYDEEDTDDESAEYEDDEPEQLEPEKISVKIDGEEVSVTLEDLKRSYSGQGKIQKGMQEAAEIRKAAEAEAQQTRQIAQQLTAMYQRVQKDGFIAPPQEPSRELFNSDPLGYMEAKMDYDAKIAEYNGQLHQMTQLQQYQQQQSQQAYQQQLMREMEILREKIPEFGDAEKASKLRESLVKTASESYGYSSEEVAGITDHRALMVLRDAMRWRQNQSKRSQAETKVKGARPVIKPQAKKVADPKRKQVQQSKSKLKQSGSIDDAIGLLFE